MISITIYQFKITTTPLKHEIEGDTRNRNNSKISCDHLGVLVVILQS